MKSITATVIYSVPGRFGPIQHVSGHRTFTDETVFRSAVRNADSVLARKGSQHIVLDSDFALAVQVSGYNARRGMYCDTIPRSELAPFLNE